MTAGLFTSIWQSVRISIASCAGTMPRKAGIAHVTDRASILMATSSTVPLSSGFLRSIGNGRRRRPQQAGDDVLLAVIHQIDCAICRTTVDSQFDCATLQLVRILDQDL